MHTPAAGLLILPRLNTALTIAMKLLATLASNIRNLDRQYYG